MYRAETTDKRGKCIKEWNDNAETVVSQNIYRKVPTFF